MVVDVVIEARRCLSSSSIRDCCNAAARSASIVDVEVVVVDVVVAVVVVVVVDLVVVVVVVDLVVVVVAVDLVVVVVEVVVEARRCLSSSSMRDCRKAAARSASIVDVVVVDVEVVDAEEERFLASASAIRDRLIASTSSESSRRRPLGPVELVWGRLVGAEEVEVA